MPLVSLVRGPADQQRPARPEHHRRAGHRPGGPYFAGDSPDRPGKCSSVQRWAGPTRTEEARGSNPLTSIPKPRRSERRQPQAGDARCHVAAAPRPQAHVTVQPGRLSETRRLGPRPHTDHTAWSPPAADRRAILAHPVQPLPVDHAVEAATAQPPPTTTTKSKLTRRWPSAACASLKRHGPPRADVPLWTRRATTPPDSLPHCHAPRPFRLDTADAGRHGHRTATPDAGGRTPGRSDTRTGHRTPISWTATRETLDARTGHRRGQGDDSTAGVRTSWASSPSDRILGRPIRSCRSCQPLPNRGGGGTCWESPDLAFARVDRCAGQVSQLGVASYLQKVVEVAVFHALEERADLGLAED